MLKPGTYLGPYEIQSSLGAGGMGEVYGACDTRLGRRVAVKVLPAAFAAEAERLKRFEREAKATAALSHPNILAVHDVGSATVSWHEVDGVEAISNAIPAIPGRLRGVAEAESAGTTVHYLVTELLEGESLKERLESGALPVREAIGIARQVSHGLAAAHEKGIVHRDIKPANIFLTKDGLVKILDFGLAKLMENVPAGEAGTLTHTSTGATEPGQVMGTVAYMAPEQARGMPVDLRTDVFAFGVVLYEMLAGKRPFPGMTAADTLAAIIRDNPRPLPDSVALSVQAVVRRCLEKSPEDRFGSASDLARDLDAIEDETRPASPPALAAATTRRRILKLVAACSVVLVVAAALVFRLMTWGGGSAGKTSRKIVVLPFENLGLPEDAYFAAGMAEEITSRLANVHGLGVISPTTAGGYDRKGKTVKQIGTDLGVEYVLEGSVRWEHGQGRTSRVRITPQLIRVEDDTDVWSDRYDRTLADVFAIQSEVAENAVKAMGVALLPHDQTALQGVSTNDLVAYDLYLRGKELAFHSDSRKDVEAALAEFRAAAGRDPNFALALAGIARNCLRMYFINLDRSQDWLAEARDAAQKAVELRPDLSETHNALGWYFYQGLGDYPQALRELDAARAIQPGNSDAIFGVGSVLRRQGKWAEAADAMEKALEIDPRNPTLLANFAASCVLAHRYGDADKAFDSAIALNPHFGGPYGRRAWLQVQWHGDVERAQSILDQAAKVADLSDDTTLLASGQLSVALARRDYQGALKQLKADPRLVFSNQISYLPTELLRGEVQMLAGRREIAQRSFEAARLELEARVAEVPDDARVHSALAIAYAALGRRTEAVREADRGSELMPTSKDAYTALRRLEDRAMVYTMVGQADDAIAQLDDLLRRSGEMTAHVLRLDPRWDPLRSNQRFQMLLTRYKVAE